MKTAIGSGIVVALAAVHALAAAQTRVPSFADVLKRAQTAVTIYEDHELSSVVARERYQQQQLDAEGRVTARRTLVSDYLLLQLPPEEDWYALRDVHEVDGSPLRDRAHRLDQLFHASPAQVGERAMAIANESARFNLGKVPRTINVPTYPLRFLRPASRHRFRFRKAGEAPIEGTPTWIIEYREHKGPTFSATTDGRDVPAHGRFWVEPATGAVVRSEMILGGTKDLPVRATIVVTYRLDPALGFRVPVEMQERYDNPRDEGADVIVAVAEYADFRPFAKPAAVRK